MRFICILPLLFLFHSAQAMTVRFHDVVVPVLDVTQDVEGGDFLAKIIERGTLDNSYWTIRLWNKSTEHTINSLHIGGLPMPPPGEGFEVTDFPIFPGWKATPTATGLVLKTEGAGLGELKQGIFRIKGTVPEYLSVAARAGTMTIQFDDETGSLFPDPVMPIKVVNTFPTNPDPAVQVVVANEGPQEQFPAIPLPSALALLATGLGMIGLMGVHSTKAAT